MGICMSKDTTHSRLLTAAARNILRPMGLVQKGRSRVWLDDHGWWICVVEFQPSSWGRGSYLNVGCMWLWHVKDYISFDEGCRLDGFNEFHDEEQFETVARSLAEHAAGEVLRYRKLFPSVSAACTHYSHLPPTGFWPAFDAAVAFGLSGEANTARLLFERIMYPDDDDRDWVLQAQAEARRLHAISRDTGQFRRVIAESIHRTRELQKTSSVGVRLFQLTAYRFAAAVRALRLSRGSKRLQPHVPPEGVPIANRSGRGARQAAAC
jgi:hypothetical protein